MTPLAGPATEGPFAMPVTVESWRTHGHFHAHTLIQPWASNLKYRLFRCLEASHVGDALTCTQLASRSSDAAGPEAADVQHAFRNRHALTRWTIHTPSDRALA